FSQGLGQCRFGAPDDAIGEVRRMGRRQRLRGAPKGDDVVVALPPRRYLDEFEGARAPLTLGFDPGAGAALILRVEILKVDLLPGSLHQSEAFGLLVGEGGYLEFDRVCERPKYL